jgi:hypothetical protein
MNEIKTTWNDLSDKELHFTASVKDWYHFNQQNATTVTKIIPDGIRLKLIGKKLRAFKPLSPITIQVYTMW